MVEYWSPKEPFELPETPGMWRYKSETDLYEFKKVRQNGNYTIYDHKANLFGNIILTSSARDRQNPYLIHLLSHRPVLISSRPQYSQTVKYGYSPFYQVNYIVNTTRHCLQFKNYNKPVRHIIQIRMKQRRRDMLSV